MRALALALCALVLAGCPDAEKEEAKRVAAALDNMRDERGATRTRLLEELEKMTIEGAQSKKARDACVAAYRPLADLQAALLKGKTADAGDIEKAKAVGASGSLLKQSQDNMPGCIEQIKALKQLAGLI